MSIKNALEELLNNLDEVDAKHPGVIHDTVVREILNETIMYTLVLGSDIVDFSSDNDYYMGTDEGNEAVHKAIVQFLTHPEVNAARVQLTTPEERLAAFQDSDVQSSEGSHYDYFFGWTDGLPGRVD
jgi:hypothetical protein